MTVSCPFFHCPFAALQTNPINPIQKWNITLTASISRCHAPVYFLREDVSVFDDKEHGSATNTGRWAWKQIMQKQEITKRQKDTKTTLQRWQKRDSRSRGALLPKKKSFEIQYTKPDVALNSILNSSSVQRQTQHCHSIFYEYCPCTVCRWSCKLPGSAMSMLQIVQTSTELERPVDRLPIWTVDNWL